MVKNGDGVIWKETVITHLEVLLEFARRDRGELWKSLVRLASNPDEIWAGYLLITSLQQPTQVASYMEMFWHCI
jgi:hypothetical protein